MQVLNKVLNKVKEMYNVIDSVVSGDGETVILEARNKNFAICPNEDGFTIYQCFRSNNEWCFLPNSKNGKSFKVVENFISNRCN